MKLGHILRVIDHDVHEPQSLIAVMTAPTSFA
jgi:hypothetical protein